jgi:hypothetical protein
MQNHSRSGGIGSSSPQPPGDTVRSVFGVSPLKSIHGAAVTVPSQGVGVAVVSQSVKAVPVKTV